MDNNKGKSEENKEQPEKIKGWVIIVVVAVVYAMIPIFLNCFVRHGVPRGLSAWSAFSSDVWFSFIGSYAGAIGTIIVGWIAYRQTEIIRQQDDAQRVLQETQRKQWEALQRLAAAYQIKPNLSFEEMSWLACNGSGQILHIQSLVNHILYQQYGINERPVGDEFIIIRIVYSSTGLVPPNEVEIESISWRIANSTYSIKLAEKKRKVNLCKELYIAVDKSDDLSDESVFDKLSLHADYPNVGKVGYARCQGSCQ